MLIEEIAFKAGAGPGSPPLVLTSPNCTVFVGPNNSGKSQVLREIAARCQSGGGQNIVLADVVFRPFTEQEARQKFSEWRTDPRPGETLDTHFTYLKYGPWREKVHTPHFLGALVNPNANDYRRQHFASYYASKFLVNLDGPSRIGLVNAKDRGDLKEPGSTFARVFTDDPRREAIRDVLFDAFGLYLGIDMSQGSNLSLRYGDTPPPPERRLEDETLEWMRSARPIETMSDGVKAFTGILIELRAGDPRIVVIDEPEAFLHPSLAFKLGKEIARTADEVGKHVFVSTHSPQFLMGAIQSGVDINVVRLTYSGGVGTARALKNDDVRAMMRDPLLRSANAVAGVFYDAVAVTEADADRAFYQEVNERLLECSPGRGASNTLFLNANGKDSVHRIVGPLRNLGIPVAAILDIDALNPKTTLQPHLEACGFPKPFHSALQQRGEIWASLSASGKSPKDDGGISLLADPDREKAENLLDLLDRYGLFILRHGEVEHWLPHLNVSRNEKWLRQIFQALGSDPKYPNYIRPSDDDVWAFMDRVSRWMRDKDRRGIRLP